MMLPLSVLLVAAAIAANAAEPTPAPAVKRQTFNDPINSFISNQLSSAFGSADGDVSSALSRASAGDASLSDRFSSISAELSSRAQSRSDDGVITGSDISGITTTYGDSDVSATDNGVTIINFPGNQGTTISSGNTASSRPSTSSAPNAAPHAVQMSGSMASLAALVFTAVVAGAYML